MKDFLLKIVTLIVDNPENVEILEEDEEGIKVYTISVPEEEMGRIIGKGGKVVNAIRCLARLKASKNKEKVMVRVNPKS
ncbi:KH domain-containing protein [Patescibacteria group bacterium]|nr:KH domain-containing protein [Patescibacteria group bacterium]